MSIVRIRLSDIRVDAANSPRDGIIPSHVADFVALGGDWEPVLVRPDPTGERQWILLDGFHRMAAAEELGLTELEARVASDKWELDAARANNHGIAWNMNQKRLYFLAHILERMTERPPFYTQQEVSLALGVNRHTIGEWIGNQTVAGAAIASLPDNDALLDEYLALGDGTANRFGALAEKYSVSDSTIEAKIKRAMGNRWLVEQQEAERLINEQVAETTLDTKMPVELPGGNIILATPRDRGLTVEEAVRLQHEQVKNRPQLAALWGKGYTTVGFALITMSNPKAQEAFFFEARPDEVRNRMLRMREWAQQLNEMADAFAQAFAEQGVSNG